MIRTKGFGVALIKLARSASEGARKQPGILEASAWRVTARRGLADLWGCVYLPALCDTYDRVVLGLVNAPRHLNPLLSGGLKPEKAFNKPAQPG